jgi:integrase
LSLLIQVERLKARSSYETALAVLRRQIGKHPTRVFTFRGEPIEQVNTKAWTGALKRAGIADFRWHDLRHTFATWHRQAGTPTHELQRLGSWKTGAMVERYAHVAPEALQSAAARLDAITGYGGYARNQDGLSESPKPLM